MFPYALFVLHAGPTTPGAPRRPRFGLAPFRSPLLGGSLLFSFPPATWMFRFAGFASALRRMPCLKHGGFPHSGIRGSLAARASPRHFAACRALHRPWEPRASPVRPCSLARRRASLPAALCAFQLSSRSGAFSMPRALVSLVCFLFVVVSKSCVLLSSLSHPVNEPSRQLPCRVSGECGARTHDPRLAKPVL